MTTTLKKELQAFNNKLMALSKKVEKMIATVDNLEKPKQPKKAPVKKTAVKGPEKLPAYEIVFGIIKRSRKGIDTAALMEKTGFNRRKIYDIVKSLKQQNRIITKDRGVYLKV